MKRTAQLFKWDLFTYRKRYFTFVGSMFVALLAFCLIQLHSIIRYNSDLAFLSITNSCMAAAASIGVIVLMAAPMMTFSNMKKKEASMAFLSLPASNLEKFLVRYVGGSLIYYTGYLAAVVLAIVVFAVITLLLGYGVPFNPLRMTPQFVTEVDQFTPVQGVEVTILLYLLAILGHAVLLLLGTLFRKARFFFAPLTALFIFYIVGYNIVVIGEKHYETMDRLLRTDWFFAAADLAMIPLIILTYWLAYRLFCRMQIVPRNKFFNI